MNKQELIDAVAGQTGASKAQTGETLDTFLQQRIFGPLGMTDTGFGVAAEDRDRIAPRYALDDNLKLELAADQSPFPVLAGTPAGEKPKYLLSIAGLYSTAQDYLRFAQMLANGGQLDGERIIGRKTLELMHANYVPSSLLPLEIGGLPMPGYGFGLGSRVLMDVAQSGAPGSVGEFGWSGAAKTHYWVDPKEDLVGLFMTQSMMSFDLPELDMRALAYQAIED